MKSLILLSNKGFSLIETLVAFGLIGLMSLGVARIIINQSRETKALTELLASLEVHSSINKIMSKNANCTFAINHPNPRTFNANSVSMNTPQVIQLNQIPAYADPGAPVAFQVNTSPSALARSLEIEDIQLSIYDRTGNIFSAEWIIRFDHEKTVRLVKPIVLPVTLTADTSAPGASRITSCASEGASLSGDFGGIYSWHYSYNRCESVNPMTSDCTCPTGFNAHLIIHNGTDDGSPGDNQDIYFCYR